MKGGVMIGLLWIWFCVSFGMAYVLWHNHAAVTFQSPMVIITWLVIFFSGVVVASQSYKSNQCSSCQRQGKWTVIESDQSRPES